VILARDRRYATNVPAIKVPCRWICTQANLTLLEPAGHWVHLDQRERFIRLVDDFLVGKLTTRRG
jgi:pimeloyl-ACP methyl ester carboxylesterase